MYQDAGVGSSLFLLLLARFDTTAACVCGRLCPLQARPAKLLERFEGARRYRRASRVLPPPALDLWFEWPSLDGLEAAGRHPRPPSAGGRRFSFHRFSGGPMTDRILILDFGSQVTQLIARRVREAGVYCEIMPFNTAPGRIADFDARGIILSGGPATITAADTPRVPAVVFDSGVLVLGICYGQMAMVEYLGGEVESAEHREFGRAFVEVTGDSRVFDGIWKVGGHEQVWMSHGDRVIRAPDGFSVVATSEGAPFAAIVDEARRYMASCSIPRWCTPRTAQN